MSLPQIRADLAQHMVYGAWAGAAGAAGALVLGLVAGRHGLALLAPAASLMMALAAGLAKEVSDWLANRRAVRAWEASYSAWLWDSPTFGAQPVKAPAEPAPPHEVSAADVVATVAGALPVAVPLFMAIWLAT